MSFTKSPQVVATTHTFSVEIVCYKYMKERPANVYLGEVRLNSFAYFANDIKIH